MNAKLGDIARWCDGALAPPEASELPVGGVSTDSRTLKRGDLFVAIDGRNFDGHAFIRHVAEAGAVAAVVEKEPRECPIPTIRVRDSVKALGKMANGYRWHGKLFPWVAITGSNGKTTTREILSAILRTRWKIRSSARNWNNFIGLPLSVMGPPDDAQVGVMEMGTSAPGEIAVLREIVVPTIAIVTSTGPSHLEGFKTEKAVAREKARIFSWLPPDGLAVYPADDPNADALAAEVPHTGATFSLEPGKGDLAVAGFSADSRGTSFSVDGVKMSLPLLGRHNVRNCLAALLAARHLGVPFRDAAGALRGLKPVAGRLQMMKTADGLRVINDSYNANPASVRMGLEVLAEFSGGRRIAVLGDMLELGADSRKFHREAGLSAAILGIDALFAVGGESVAMAEAAQANARIIVRYCPSVEAVVRELEAYVEPGDCVLVKASRGMKMERVVDALLDWRRR